MSNGRVAGFVRALIRPQVLRTCTKCGHSWHLSRYLTKRHFQGVRGDGLEMPATRQEIAESRTSNELVGQARSAFRTCPHCGSDVFTQRRMWHESKSVFDGDDHP
jgi:hypothetical protein